jgi:hypothetical protein
VRAERSAGRVTDVEARRIVLGTHAEIQRDPHQPDDERAQVSIAGPRKPPPSVLRWLESVVEPPDAQAPRAAVLMEDEEKLMISLCEVQSDEIVVVALGTRLVARKDGGTVDPHGYAVVCAEKEYVPARVRHMKHGGRVGDPLAVTGFE